MAASPPTPNSLYHAEAGSFSNSAERFSNGTAGLRNRDLRVRNCTRHTIKVMNHARVAHVAYRHTGKLERLRIRPALIAQRIELGGMNMRRRQSAQVRRAQWRDSNIGKVRSRPTILGNRPIQSLAI